MKHTVRPGQKFGRLTVIIPQGKTRSGKTAKLIPLRTALCKCKCGKWVAPGIARLINGHIKSCGCLKREALSQGQIALSHGMSYSLEYGPWRAMHQRCNNPSSKDFPNWGGKGVTITPAWDEFAQFYADMGPRPSPKHTLDRWPNKQGDYKPGNVRWATPRQQNENRKSNIFVLLKGERLTLKSAAKQLNFPPTKAYNRRRRGWPPERWFEPVAVVQLASD